MQKRLAILIGGMLLSGSCFAVEGGMTQLAKDEDIKEGTEKQVELLYGAKRINIWRTRFRSIPLSQKRPGSIKKEPEYISETPLYGSIKLGNAPDSVFLLAVDRMQQGPKGTYYIYIDSNKNGDLSDETPLPSSFEEEGYGSRIVNFSLPVGYTIGDEKSEKILDYRGNVQQDNIFRLYTQWLYSGMMEASGTPRHIKIYDKNGDALFDGDDILLVDINGDGELDASQYSVERMKLSDPFKIADKTYMVKAVSPDGQKMIISETTREAKAMDVIDIGSQAPPFARIDILTRKEITPELFKEAPVLLSFASHQNTNEAINLIEELLKRSPEKKARFILVVDPWNLDNVLRQIGEGEKGFYLVLDTGVPGKTLREQFNLDSNAYNILIDPNGKIFLKEKTPGIEAFWKIMDKIKEL